MKRSVIEDARRLRFDSFGPMDDSELENAVVHHQSRHCLLLSVVEADRTQLCWACDDVVELTEAIRTYTEAHGNERIYIEFIPKRCKSSLERIGFVEHSEFIDYWLHEVKPVEFRLDTKDASIREATESDFPAISDITRRCADQSRGFTVETPDTLAEWMSDEHSLIFVVTSSGQVVGHALVSLYGFDSAKGTVLWMRELAVRPESQRQGIGSALHAHAINWGCRRGAKRSFLHCDKMNRASIQLCKGFGYQPASDGGQINMIFESDSVVR